VATLRRRLATVFLTSLLWALAGCSSAPEPAAPTAEPTAPAATASRDKSAWFGDLHIHTRWSFDAYSMKVRVGPEDAYRFARGEAIDHVSGKKIQLLGPPLDFMGLTEHGTYMGVSAALDDPEHPLRAIPFVQKLTDPDPAISGAALTEFMGSLGSSAAIPELVSDAVVKPTWQAIVELADRHDAPGRFTAFPAYEYTSMPDGQNLHRNVIFRGSDVPDRPFTSLDSNDPERLWAWMDEVRQRGDDVLAIPHNANGSNGLMYQTVTTSGDPIDALYAEVRLRNEPISEVMQIKGQSETHPVLSLDDEWADFEVADMILGRPADFSEPRGSYVRQALKDGLLLEAMQGFNPYRIGMIGSSDGHNASSPVEEANYTGKLGVLDGTPEARLHSVALPASGDFEGVDNMPLRWGAAGLAGVWAESNTREALFDAMRARETFATSGPRIRVRLFGGFGFEPGDLEGDIAEPGYARGVPMGGELEAGLDAGAPTFLVRALKDPNEAPLERLQIIKGWIEDGEAREAVFDVACADGADPNSGTHRCSLASRLPDLTDCSIEPGDGRAQLSAHWRDPGYRPGQRAFYYARVLQIPTCRWSTYDALRLGVPRPEPVPASIQERAVTSPIWLEPKAS
jgi:hypothetical protein